MIEAGNKAELKFNRSKALQAKAHSLIPGGAHTYAKGDDQYPESAPAYIVRGSGCHVWDIDGNEFIEYGMGLRAVTLGHSFTPVVEAAHQQMLLGSNFTRPSPIEVECAETLADLIPCAEMVKFGKNGSDATSAAVRLSRAYTGRDLVAICGDQPFLSVDDWFIGSTAMSAGIPKAVRDLTVKFRYNDIENLRSLFAEHPDKVACVIMEAATAVEPLNGYLQEVKNLCHQNGAIFVLDEMITGFRWHLGGAQAYYGVTPDLATFGKGLGNGFSVSALAGKKEILERGGICHGHERVFLLSLTHGAENHSLAASLATMRVYKEQPVIEHLYRQGERLRTGVNRSIAAHRLQGYFEILGKSPNLVYATRDQDKQPSQAFRTLFLQETLQRGFLMPSVVVSYSHQDPDIDRTIEAIDEALAVYRRALRDGVEKYLNGRPVKPVFRRFN